MSSEDFKKIPKNVRNFKRIQNNSKKFSRNSRKFKRIQRLNFKTLKIKFLKIIKSHFYFLNFDRKLKTKQFLICISIVYFFKLENFIFVQFSLFQAKKLFTIIYNNLKFINLK